jgi:hypothetical protein
MAPFRHPGREHVAIHLQAEAYGAGQGQVQPPSPLQPRERWPRRHPWRLFYVFLTLRPPPSSSHARCCTAGFCAPSGAVGAPTGTATEEGEDRDRGATLTNLNLERAQGLLYPAPVRLSRKARIGKDLRYLYRLNQCMAVEYLLPRCSVQCVRLITVVEFREFMFQPFHGRTPFRSGRLAHGILVSE